MFLRIISRIMNHAIKPSTQPRRNRITLQAPYYRAAYHSSPRIPRLQNWDATACPGEDATIEVFTTSEAADEKDCAHGFFGGF
jgi:hypothetical protein